MPGITLDGKSVKAEAGQTVLDVARQNGVHIPTLCHHPGLAPYGACRLCLVEIKAGFRTGLTASCALPAMEGLVVETGSSMVLEGRRLVVELLLARAPGSKEIRALAQSLGVDRTDIPPKDELCILCGRCVRACKALGVDAISFVQRGEKRRVAVPFDRPSEHCMACQACVSVCPTGAIRAKVTTGHVEMVEWRTHQVFQKCIQCGRPVGTERQQAHILKTIDPLHQSEGSLCPRCRRRKTARAVTSIPPARFPLVIDPDRDLRYT